MKHTKYIKEANEALKNGNYERACHLAAVLSKFNVPRGTSLINDISKDGNKARLAGDHKKALTIGNALTKQKKPHGYYLLGLICEDGVIVKKNTEKAIQYFIKSADKEYDPALRKLSDYSDNILDNEIKDKVLIILARHYKNPELCKQVGDKLTESGNETEAAFFYNIYQESEKASLKRVIPKELHPIFLSPEYKKHDIKINFLKNKWFGTITFKGSQRADFESDSLENLYHDLEKYFHSLSANFEFILKDERSLTIGKYNVNIEFIDFDTYHFLAVEQRNHSYKCKMEHTFNNCKSINEAKELTINYMNEHGEDNTIKFLTTFHKAALKTNQSFNENNYLGLEKSRQRPRHTHCFSCKHPIDSETFYGCKACGWIVCFCGACGCSYMQKY